MNPSTSPGVPTIGRTAVCPAAVHPAQARLSMRSPPPVFVTAATLVSGCAARTLRDSASRASAAAALAPRAAPADPTARARYGWCLRDTGSSVHSAPDRLRSAPGAAPCPLALRRPRLQREPFMPGSRAHRDPVGDGVADQVIQRNALCRISTQPRTLGVALDQPAPLAQLADALGDVLDQCLQLDRDAFGQKCRWRPSPLAPTPTQSSPAASLKCHT